MKIVRKILAICLAVFFCAGLCATAVGCAGKTDAVKIMSFNIRLYTNTDIGNRHWRVRRPLLAEYVLGKDADVICFQEVTQWQYEDIKEDFEPKGYEIYWTGRDKSKNPEGLAVLWKKDKFEEIERNTFWLSETPDKMSKYKGGPSMCNRVCVNATLKVKTEEGDGAVFTVYNTHLDLYKKVQEFSMKLTTDRAREKGTETIICGDFNCNEEGEPSNAFLNSLEYYNDCRLTAKESAEKIYTYNNFGDTESPFTAPLHKSPIDHCLVEKNIDVDKFEICTETPAEGSYYSDHYPIIAHLRIPRAK